MHYAALTGNITEIVKLYDENNKINLNSNNNTDHTPDLINSKMESWFDYRPLDWACSNFQLHAVVMLVMLKADFNEKNSQDMIPEK